MGKMYSSLLLMQVVCWKRKGTNTKRDIRERGGGERYVDWIENFTEVENLELLWTQKYTPRLLETREHVEWLIFLSDFEA